MGGAPIVIPLVGLVFPIILLLLALLFDAAVVTWAGYRLWKDRVWPRLALVGVRTSDALYAAMRSYRYRFAHR